MKAKLDIAYYPHLFDLIIDSADDSTLRALRGVCKLARSHVDRRLQRHIVYDAVGSDPKWDGPIQHTYRGQLWAESWCDKMQVDVLDVLWRPEGLFPSVERAGGTPQARKQAEETRKLAEIEPPVPAFWRHARLVRLFPDEDVRPFSRRAKIVRFIDDLPAYGPAGQILGLGSVWLNLTLPRWIGRHGGDVENGSAVVDPGSAESSETVDTSAPPVNLPPEPAEPAESRFILNFEYHQNTFPHINVRRSNERSDPDSQFKLCIFVFTSSNSEMRPDGKSVMKLASMRRFWGLLRLLNSYTLGSCRGHGLQGDWHEEESAERVPSLLSYIFVGTEKWVFDLSDVEDNAPRSYGRYIDPAEWKADIEALRKEKPSTPDFQLMLEAGLARWYEPDEAETFNDVMDHVFYDTAEGFRNRYQHENYELIMRR